MYFVKIFYSVVIRLFLKIICKFFVYWLYFDFKYIWLGDKVIVILMIDCFLKRKNV